MKSLTGYLSLKVAATLCVVVALTSCGVRTQTVSSRGVDETAVLAQSSFHAGEIADDPMLFSTLGDGGVIAGGPGNGGGGDGGTIPPTTPPVTPPAEEPPTGPIAENPPVTPVVPSEPPVIPPTEPVSPPIAETPPTTPTEPVVPPIAQTPPTTPPPSGGNDGGNVPDSSGPGGGPDGGSVVPPIAEVPPVQPPVIPPVVPPVVPPGDGGAICVGCMDINIDRVCSENRSKIPFPQFVFFEEARDPRLTLETRVQVPTSTPSSTALAGIGAVGELHPVESQLLNLLLNAMPRSSKGITMGAVDLAEVDLMQGRYTTKVALAKDTIRAWFPDTWRNIYLEARVCDDRDRDGLCSDESDANQLLAVKKGFTLRHTPSRLNLLVWNGRTKTLKNNPDLCEQQYSPLVLDLSGDGLRFSSPENGVVFDLNDTGDQLLTGWTMGRDDAFLVRDINGNGTIDSGAELFGSATKLLSGQRAANGFLALAELDSNANGQFDAGDAAWEECRLWLDRNRDGVSDTGEMFSLSRAGVQSINLNYVDVSELDTHGNETRQRAVFRRVVNGKTYLRQVIDIWFATLAIAE